jgi:HNH endonuclease
MSKPYIKENIIGKVCGQITILDAIGKDKYQRMVVLGKCSCGTLKKFVATEIITGRIKSCGCLIKQNQWGLPEGYKFCNDCSATKKIEEFGSSSNCKPCGSKRASDWNVKNPGKSAYSHCNQSSCRIGIPFTLTKDEFILWYTQAPKVCEYCDIEETISLKIFQERLHIERMNSDLGYTLENITLACFPCNTVKSKFLSYKEMKDVGQKYIKPKWNDWINSKKIFINRSMKLKNGSR